MQDNHNLYPGLLSDRLIGFYATEGKMITPFINYLTRKVETVVNDQVIDRPVISYGLSSYGYDIRLSTKEFKIYKPNQTLSEESIIDPKAGNANCLSQVPLIADETGCYFVMPPHSYGLGVSIEYFSMPSNIMAICVGKSTYARSGITANITPLEAGWKGYLTLEFSNDTNYPVKMYANEGVAQLLFFRNTPCDVSYSDRQGKYQNQLNMITLPRV